MPSDVNEISEAAKKAAARKAEADAAAAKKAADEEAARKAEADAAAAKKADDRKATATGPLVKEAIHHNGRLYRPGEYLPADTDTDVLVRHRELGNI